MAYSPPAGPLRNRVTIVTPASVRDEGGQLIYDYTTAPVQSIDRWVNIRTLAGRELAEASAVHAEVSHEVRLHYTDGITSKSRVTHKGRTLEVVSMNNVQEEGVDLLLLCTERGV
jgi:SPP1 family predicted phage head-tail adaptor